MAERKKLGVLTGGCDTSALNATLKGIALEAEDRDWEVVGIQAGWAGLLGDGAAVRLSASAIDENRGGTIIRTSRTNLRKIKGGVEQASKRIRQLQLDGLIAIGGDDTLTVGVELGKFHHDIPVDFVTKTIDNDVGTNPDPNAPFDETVMKNYFCPGFPTAAEWLIEATDALRTTAYSHDRILVLEAMGRTAGWLSLATAYGHPDFIILPESPLDLERFVELVAKRYADRKNVIIVVAEGAKGLNGNALAEADDVMDAFGHKRLGGSSTWLASQLKDHLATRRKIIAEGSISAVIPSYLQRCGSPTSVDREMGIQLGRAAVKALVEGNDGLVGCPVVKDDVVRAAVLPVDDVLPRSADGTIIPRTVDPRLFDPDNYVMTPLATHYFRRFMGNMAEPYAAPELMPYNG